MAAPRIIALCAAPGSGKSTLLPHLVRRLAPRVVIDLDELKEPDGTLLGVPIVGVAPAFDQLVMKILGMITRAGHTVVVLAQVPSAEGLADPTSPVTDWLLLDCTDDARRVRLAERGVTSEQVREVIAAAELGRRMIGRVVLPRPGESVDQIADRVAEMIRTVDPAT